MNKFLRSKDYGDIAEKAIISKFRTLGILCDKSDDKRWDLNLSIFDKTIKVEVKHDLKSALTGNLAIEYFNPKKNKESGISASVAHLWIYYLPSGNILTTSLKRLKKFCDLTPPLKTIDKGGDKNASLYIYELETIRPIFFDLSELCDIPLLTCGQMYNAYSLLNQQVIKELM